MNSMINHHSIVFRSYLTTPTYFLLIILTSCFRLIVITDNQQPMDKHLYF